METNDKCNECGRHNTMYCNICEDMELFVTPEQNEAIERMCDLMCGKVEDE